MANLKMATHKKRVSESARKLASILDMDDGLERAEGTGEVFNRNKGKSVILSKPTHTGNLEDL